MRSSCRRNSLAGDNEHDVIFCILAGADGELLRAQLELVASLDIVTLAIDLDIGAVDSASGVDLCALVLDGNQLFGDLLSLSSLIQILGLNVGVPDILIAVILAQCSLDVRPSEWHRALRVPSSAVAALTAFFARSSSTALTVALSLAAFSIPSSWSAT